jgi:hypothetical protein
MNLVAGLQRDSGVKVQLHDLRRTLISRLGVAENIAELANGHRRGNLVARYKRTKRGRPVSRPSKKVSAHISALLAAADDARGNVRAGRMTPARRSFVAARSVVGKRPHFLSKDRNRECKASSC